ncbi:MAG: GxxExxY protein [Allosphingosinicella sp.]
MKVAVPTVSREHKTMSDVEKLAAEAIECGFAIHRDLGPGLLESCYEILLAASLARVGLAVERQKIVDIEYMGISVREAFRADLIIERRLIIEVKAVDRLAAIHSRQVLTYLKLLNLPLGLVMNFGGGTFREGLKRIANTRH